MTVQTLKLSGRDFVLIPKRDFDRLQSLAKQQEQDQGDIAEAGRRKARGASRPYSRLRKRLGLG